MRWLLCFFYVSQLTANSFASVRPSTPEEIASLNADLLIEGYISPLSGQVSLNETDLHVRGAQDLFFKRTYVAPQIFGRYDDKDDLDRFLLGTSLDSQKTKRWVFLSYLGAGFNNYSPYFQVCDPNGCVLEFVAQGNKAVLKNSYGLSNLRHGKPNSTADLRNIELFYDKDALHIIWLGS